LEAQQHTFCSHFKRVFKQNFRPKSRTRVCLRRLGAPLPNPCVVIPTYYYNFVEFVSSIRYILFRSKKKPSNYNKCSAFASSALLHLFFNSNSVSFVERGRKNISSPRAGYPIYATGPNNLISYFLTQRWLPRRCPWPRERPRGQFLKSLALASNPPCPQKLACPRSRTAAFCFLLSHKFL